MSVNKDHMRKVTEAMRSEKYRQTTGALRDEKGFCALGVASDVSGLGQWELVEGSDSFQYVTESHYEGASLAPEVREWLGLDQFDLFWKVTGEDGEDTDVMDLNDDWEYDLHRIAALIEKRYEL